MPDFKNTSKSINVSKEMLFKEIKKHKEHSNLFFLYLEIAKEKGKISTVFA